MCSVVNKLECVREGNLDLVKTALETEASINNGSPLRSPPPPVLPAWSVFYSSGRQAPTGIIVQPSQNAHTWGVGRPPCICIARRSWNVEIMRLLLNKEGSRRPQRQRQRTPDTACGGS